MQTDVSYESSFRLSCPIPEWGSMFTAAALLLKIRGDGTDIEKQTFGLQYIPVKELWLSQNASVGDASGGTPILIETRGVIVDLASLPYECIFKDAVGGKAVSLPVTPLSPREILCITPDWGRKHTAGQTTMSLFNRMRGLLVPYEGKEGANTFTFTPSWFQIQQTHIPASGSDLVIIGFGLRKLSKYRCLLEATNDIGDVPRRLASHLSFPTSSSTVICNIPAWGEHHASDVVNVTLMDDNGLHVFFSGLPVQRQLEIRESWISVQPNFFLANAAFSVTVTGFGFHLGRLYNCSLTWNAESFWSTQYKVEEWAMEDSYAVEQITTLQTSPLHYKSLVCELPRWGALYAARTAVLSVTRIADSLSREVILVGEEAASKISMDPTWHSITPTRYGWVGLGAITVRGAGFDNTRRLYQCEWHNPFYRVKSAFSLPVDSTHFVCHTPNLVQFKEISSNYIAIDGESQMALTSYSNFSVFFDDTEIIRDPPQLFNNGSFMFR
jgi:hypothetical protein